MSADNITVSREKAGLSTSKCVSLLFQHMELNCNFSSDSPTGGGHNYTDQISEANFPSLPFYKELNE